MIRYVMMPLVLVLAVGCAGGDKPGESKEQKEVKEVFAALQEAMRSKNGERIWSFLDADTQDDLEQAAKTVREQSKKATAEKRAADEKKFGLSGTKLENLKGK